MNPSFSFARQSHEVTSVSLRILGKVLWHKARTCVTKFSTQFPSHLRGFLILSPIAPAPEKRRGPIDKPIKGGSTSERNYQARGPPDKIQIGGDFGGEDGGGKPNLRPVSTWRRRKRKEERHTKLVKNEKFAWDFSKFNIPVNLACYVASIFLLSFQMLAPTHTEHSFRVFNH